MASNIFILCWNEEKWTLPLTLPVVTACSFTSVKLHSSWWARFKSYSSHCIDHCCSPPLKCHFSMCKKAITNAIVFNCNCWNVYYSTQKIHSLDGTHSPISLPWQSFSWWAVRRTELFIFLESFDKIFKKPYGKQY